VLIGTDMLIFFASIQAYKASYACLAAELGGNQINFEKKNCINFANLFKRLHVLCLKFTFDPE
jgi:hypothetical protein